ncbi:MAG: polysulfide reductase NrfD [Candidatus Rokubacteria bacterium]|nr:polysulfide reductase NrfD [Candidatus Rokubacteria bacterium]
MNGQNVWGWKVAAYLFASGTGAGAYAVGLAAQRLGSDWSSVAGTGLLLGPALVAPAALLLIWDLGRPAGFLRAGRRPASSWISRGVVILCGFILVGGLHAALSVWPWGRPAPPDSLTLVLSAVGGLLALLTTLYTGLLLGAIRPIPFWSTPVLPLLFLVSSLSTGIMAVDLTLTLWQGVTGPSLSDALGGMRRADLLFLALEAVVIACYLRLTHATQASRASIQLLTRGALAVRFWAGVVAAGLVVPFLIQLLEVTSAVPSAGGLSLLSSVAGLFGGLLLRHVVVAGGVREPLSAAGILLTLPGRARV